MDKDHNDEAMYQAIEDAKVMLGAFSIIFIPLFTFLFIFLVLL